LRIIARAVTEDDRDKKSSIRRIKMKRVVSIIIATMFIFCSSYCFAASSISSMLGSWSVKAEGALLLKGDKPGEKTHRDAAQKTFTGEIKVLEQDGRILKGELISKKATEKFIAVIAPDNKSIYYADEDGIMDIKMIDKNTAQFVYRHVTEKDTVVAVGTWKRKK
jgi:hypothetical protein